LKNKQDSYKSILLNGIIFNNPTFVQLLGMCPALAISTSVTNAIGMGLSTMFVLVFSNLCISLLRKFVPSNIRIASYVIIIASFVTTVEMILAAFFPSISSALGIFIPLIVVNCIILARAESFASQNPVLPSVLDGFACGLGFTLSLTVIASVRELLGSGTLLGFNIFWASFKPAAIFLSPAGGFLTLGCLIALVNFISSKFNTKKEEVS